MRSRNRAASGVDRTELLLVRLQRGFHGGALEISASGTVDLPMGMESITGYTIIEAESLDEAEKIARDNPYIASIRVYEIMGGK